VKKATIFLALAALSSACTAETNMDWPQLPSSGFLSGRAATNADVEAGQAVFSMDGKSEGALPIAIPQYALWTDESGAAHPVVVVQAEKAPGGLEIVGLLHRDGSHAAATMAELGLLGTAKSE
jgi:hypothetical protein